jgi:hypothetical protein
VGADELGTGSGRSAKSLGFVRRKGEETWESWYGISMLVLSPKEASRTRAISMASLDLRFIIWGSGDPGHQSERVYHLSF